MHGRARLPGEVTAVVLLLGVVLAAGCARANVAELRSMSPSGVACAVPIREQELLVGVALSGGGSRAALFGAAGLEALAGVRTRAGASVLERVAFVSSVSGGSIAGGYYTLNKPPHEVPVLEPDGTLSPAYREFFDRSRSLLSQNFESRMIRRQFTSFRWLNSFLFARSLGEVLRDRLLGSATLLDLSRRQARGDTPGLIVNTTLYNNGRRLALTTLSSDEFRYDLISQLQASSAQRGHVINISPALATGWDALMPMTLPDLGADPCPLPLAGAVTGSASFPPIIGPITLRVAGEETYWHAGDGGLYENQGVESLVFLFLKQLQEGRARRALVIAFDSSFPFSVGDRRLSRRSKPFSLFTFDFSRVPSIMEERATTYRGLFFRTLQMDGVLPGTDAFRLVLLRHTDAKWREDLSDLPAACRTDSAAPTSAMAVVQRLAEIPTRLRVASLCDRELLTLAAAKVVAQQREAILGFVDQVATAAP